MTGHARAVRTKDTNSQIPAYPTGAGYTFKFDEAEIIARGDNHMSRELLVSRFSGSQSSRSHHPSRLVECCEKWTQLLMTSSTRTTYTTAIFAADEDVEEGQLVVFFLLHRELYVLVLLLVTAAIMPNLAGLDYVTDCAPPRMMIRGSRPGQFNPFPSPTTDAEY
ncbi:unnamed protein product [Schistocephalus solidus]|uniref:Uncharacterized protein n=1 Tax=Schistocephalus solidus TaxID=70667 RepID=A0A183T434_SCHSO|nr:unnamed protein product [Schistocephalus solidus]